MQADASTLQQELQDLQSSTTKARHQMQDDVSSLQGQLDQALTDCQHSLHQKETAHADSHKDMSNLQGQLATAANAQAVADSAQSDAKKLQQQLSEAFISFDLDTKKLQQQLTEAQAAAESAQAGTQKVLQQQRTELQARSEQQQRTELQARSQQSKKRITATHHAKLPTKVPISNPGCADMLWVLQPLPCNSSYHKRL